MSSDCERRFDMSLVAGPSSRTDNTTMRNNALSDLTTGGFFECPKNSRIVPLPSAPLLHNNGQAVFSFSGESDEMSPNRSHSEQFDLDKACSLSEEDDEMTGSPLSDNNLSSSDSGNFARRNSSSIIVTLKRTMSLTGGRSSNTLNVPPPHPGNPPRNRRSSVKNSQSMKRRDCPKKRDSPSSDEFSYEVSIIDTFGSFTSG